MQVQNGQLQMNYSLHQKEVKGKYSKARGTRGIVMCAPQSGPLNKRVYIHFGETILRYN